MIPSNDFTRPPATGATRRMRWTAAAAAIAVTLSAAAWTLSRLDFGLWPIVGAASLFPMDHADAHRDDRPQYAGDRLQRPDGHERWIAVGASLGLSYSEGASPHEAFHQVRIAPSAYDAFVKTGVFPEGTMLALEVSTVGRSVLPARAGQFADRTEGLEIAVKDQRATPAGWAYYSFGDGGVPAAQPFPSTSCSSCHQAHAATDSVFTQFYPRLARRR